LRPPDHHAAVRAMRRRADETLAARHPINADIQETADNGAENEKRDRPEMERQLLKPGARIAAARSDELRRGSRVFPKSVCA
jgi:hypothetical protein